VGEPTRCKVMEKEKIKEKPGHPIDSIKDGKEVKVQKNSERAKGGQQSWGDFS